MRAASTLAVVLAFAGACDQVTDPLTFGPRRIQVEAVLDLGFRNQYATINWSSPDARMDPIPDAVATLRTSDGLVIVAGLPNITAPTALGRLYQFKLDTSAVTLKPGETYQLTVAVGGTEVTGKTIVPTATMFSSDSGLQPTLFTRLRDTVRLSWPRFAGTSHYQISVVSQFRRPGTGELLFENVYSFFGDTSVVLAGTDNQLASDNPVFQVGTSTIIMVHAVDENYYTYYHASTDPFAGAPPSRLSGGLGVLGSIVPVVIRHYTVR